MAGWPVALKIGVKFKYSAIGAKTLSMLVSWPSILPSGSGGLSSVVENHAS
jgi:hypothetical protein